MSSLPPPPSATGGPDRRLELAGAVLLAVGGSALCAVVLWSLATGPLLALGVAALTTVALVGAFAPVSSLAVLVAVVAGAVAILGIEDGIQVTEVVYGLAMVSYLAGWYGGRLASGTRVLLNGVDVAMALWLTVGIGGGVALGLLFGPNPAEFRGELIAVVPFYFYFPVREACVRTPNGVIAIVLAYAWLGVYATFANALALQSAVSAATEAWQVADARFTTGESYMGLGFLLALALTVGGRTAAARVASLALAAVLLAGLILTRTRGFWISTALGLVVMILAQAGPARRRSLGYLSAGVAAMAAVTVVLFRDEALLLLAGTIGRFESLGSAGQDISLVSRFAEYRALWERILANPVLGYGWGVTYSHFTPLSLGTRTWSFTHNGWLSIWYKTGLWGLLLMGSAWVAAAWSAFRAARAPWLRPVDRALGAALVGSIAAYALAANAANPFQGQDLVLAVTLLLAMAAGLGSRTDAERPTAGRSS